MQISFYKFVDREIKEVDANVFSNDWQDKVDWINIRYENKSEIADYLSKISLPADYLEHIIHKDNDIVPKSGGKYFVEHFPVSKAEDIYESDYITLFISAKLIVTIKQQYIKPFIRIFFRFEVFYFI